MNDKELHESIGYIKRAVEEHTGALASLKSDVSDIKKKVTLITGWAMGVAAVISLMFAVIKEWWTGKQL